MTAHPALAWYARVLALAPRRRDLTIPQLLLMSQRALALSGSERTAIAVDLARFRAGEVTCPKCSDAGPHAHNDHHRFYKMQFKCRACGNQFNTLQINHTNTKEIQS